MQHYRMIFNGYRVISEVSLQTFQPTIQEAVNDYTEYTFQIDTWYRKFYYYLDRIGIQNETGKLRQLVENVYTNKYLADFSYKWNQSLSAEQYQTYSGSRQEDFFHDFVGPLGCASEMVGEDLETLAQKKILFVAGGGGPTPVYPPGKQIHN